MGPKRKLSSQLGTESVLMQAELGRRAGAIVDGHDVKATRGIADVALGEKALRGAYDHALLVGGDAQLRERGEFFARGSCAYFHEGERFAIVPDQIDFALGAAGHEVPRDKNVAMLAKIPVGIGFSADAGAPRFGVAGGGGVRRGS